MFHLLKIFNLMINKLGNIAKLQLVKDSLKLSSGNVLMYLIPMVVTPILSRLYTPEQFGEWGIFSSTITIIEVVLLGGFEYALIKCKENEVYAVQKLCAFSAMCVLSMCIVAFAVGDFLKISVVQYFPFPIGAVIFLVFNSVLLILQNLANRYEQYWTISKGNLTVGASQAVLRISFAFCAILVNGLILGTICAQIIGCIFLYFSLRKVLKAKQSRGDSRINVVAVAKKYKNFPLYDAPASLLSFAAFNLPIIILASFYSKGDVGCYSMVLQLLLMPISVIGAAIGKVYYQRISANNNMETIQSETRNVLRIVVWLAILPTSFFCVGGDWLLVKFLGDRWYTAGEVALCLSLWSVATILTQPLMSLYRLLDKQNRMLAYNVIYFACGIGAMLLCSAMRIPLYATILIYSICAFIPKIWMLWDMIKLAETKLPKSFIMPMFVVYATALGLLVIRFFIKT